MRDALLRDCSNRDCAVHRGVQTKAGKVQEVCTCISSLGWVHTDFPRLVLNWTTQPGLYVNAIQLVRSGASTEMKCQYGVRPFYCNAQLMEKKECYSGNFMHEEHTVIYKMGKRKVKNRIKGWKCLNLSHALKAVLSEPDRTGWFNRKKPDPVTCPLYVLNCQQVIKLPGFH